MTGVVRIYHHGAPSALTFEDEHVGEPGAHQVRLRQEAVGVNFVDTMFRDGTFPLSRFPAVLGMEAAGTVESVGSTATDWNVGDRAGYWTTIGAYAHTRLIDAANLVPIPDDITSEQAAAYLTKGLLAWVLTHQIHPVKPGQTVVVGPAAGALGSMTARWAKAKGAHVIGLVGSPAKADTLADAHLDHVLVSTEPGAAAGEIGDITGPRGVDALFDGVGGAGFGVLSRLVTQGGTAVLFGGAAGYPSGDVNALTSRGVTFVQPSTAQYVTTPEAARNGANAVFAALRQGIFGNSHPTVYDLSDAARAHADLGARRTTGALLLKP